MRGNLIGHPRPIQRRRGALARIVRHAVAACSTSLCALAADRSWNNPGGGSWHTPANWSPASVPTSADDAVFNLVAAPYTLSFSADATANNLAVARGSVSFDLSGRQLNAAGRLDVGTTASLSGSLTLNNGTAIFSGSTFSAVGGAGAVGAVNLNNATLTLSASAGIGLMGGTGTVTVNGVNAKFSSTTSFLSIGDGDQGIGQSANGTLRIINGGRSSANTAVYIGFGGGNGLVDINGTGGSSKLEATAGTISIGQGVFDGVNTHIGTGTLLIQSGGQAVASGNIHVGSTLGVGTAIVSGANSKLTSTSGMIHLGDTGTGTLLLDGGGEATSSSHFIIGYNGGSGRADASGANTKIQSTGGFTDIGDFGAINGSVFTPSRGTLNLSSGAQLLSSSHVLIGVNGASGQVNLTGANSRLESSSGILDIGDFGYTVSGNFTASDGSLNVNASAQVIASSDAYIGFAGGKGTVNIDSATLSIGQALSIGRNSNGALVPVPGRGIVTVTNGGRINSASAIVGASGGDATITLSGIGTAWNNTGDMDLGNGGNATLSLSNKASATVGGTLKVWSGGSLNLASDALLRVATLNLSGSPSRLNWTGGTLRINSLAPAIDGTLVVPNSGTLGGVGTINRVTSVSAGGTLAPGESFGKLSFGDNLTLASSSTVYLEIGGTGTSPGTAGTHYDQVFISGMSKTINLGGANLQIRPAAGIVAGVPHTYTIVGTAGGASVTGIFAGMASEAIVYSQGLVSFTVDYDPDYVKLTFTVIPEPGALGALGAAMLLLRRRERTKQKKL